MKLLIHTTSGQKQELDLTDVLAIDIQDEGGPLFELRVDTDRPALQVHSTRAMTTMLVRPLASNGVEVRAERG